MFKTLFLQMLLMQAILENLVLNDSPKRINQGLFYTYSSATNEVISEESQISLNKDTSNLRELLELLPTNLPLTLILM